MGRTTHRGQNNTVGKTTQIVGKTTHIVGKTTHVGGKTTHSLVERLVCLNDPKIHWHCYTYYKH